ncbi:MAG TPA: NAD-dependent epimerase/dehydratase family protein [Acidimicrobiales bacterium]|nr:NAD-dependent epimerase/dehydratase family protein [Acidimicrobiales bacterium]
MSRYFIAGGAGFIGSNLVARLLDEEPDARVVVYDNFLSGHRWHLEAFADDDRLAIVEGDIADTQRLNEAVYGSDHLFQLAANADIAAAVNDPSVDFRLGTFLVHQVLEAARLTGVSRVTYTSGSGVYGDLGSTEIDETYGPLQPVSTYGASKLAGESLVSAYCHMFDIEGVAFRFANVIGPRQTHGIVYDFVRKLLADPTRLVVMGDGSQSKSYVHVADVLDAVFLMKSRRQKPFDVYNVGTDEYVTVRDIAELVIEVMGLGGVEINYGSEPRGWKGDVPIVRFSSKKIRGLGWNNSWSSRDALRESAVRILSEAQQPH